MTTDRVNIEEDFLYRVSLESLAVRKTTQKGFFEDSRGISISPGNSWSRKNKTESYLSPAGFVDFKKGDTFTLSITSHIDDRLASGSQASTEDITFLIDSVHLDCIDVTEISREKNTSKNYPNYGKNRRIR